MNYLSTRGDTTRRSFCQILLEGLAPDGGLLLAAGVVEPVTEYTSHDPPRWSS